VSLVRPLEAVVAEFMLPQHRLSQVLIVLGMGALLLAVVGVFALTSFAVNQRTQEIAVRQSLGATTTNVLAHLIWSSARVTLIAAAVGLAGAVAGARLLQSLLVGLSPLDPVSYAVPVLALGITTTVAAYLAARRAARIPPVLALRAG
jgi:ABC-type antimicrobial peptide transport system permease subunit